MKRILLFLVLISSIAHGQRDTLKLKNKDILVGLVESYDIGVLVFSTSYSDSDFKIEFDKITSIYIHKKCIVTLTKSRRRFGKVRTIKPGIVTIETNKNLVETFKISEIIAFQEVSEDRRKRFSGSVDFGYDFTKAQDKRQTTVNATLGYVGELWVTNGSLNIHNSQQGFC